MTTKLLIDRELLERLADKNAFLHHTRKAQDELRAAIDSAPCDPRCTETCVRASMCATCMNALAAPPQPAGDGLEVVAYMDHHDTLSHDAPRTAHFALMTVAQHQRIVASISAQQSAHVSVPRELLVKHLREIGEYAWEENTDDQLRALLNGGEA